MKKRGKKAVSPVVSTVLLIMIVVILAIIIFLWARSFIGEEIEKFEKPIGDVCRDVNLRASIEGGNLLLINRGNVPIYAIDIKKISAGTSKVEQTVIDLDGGSSQSQPLSITTGVSEIVVIPVLIGKSGNTKKKFTCENMGVEIQL